MNSYYSRAMNDLDFAEHGLLLVVNVAISIMSLSYVPRLVRNY